VKAIPGRSHGPVFTRRIHQYGFAITPCSESKIPAPFTEIHDFWFLMDAFILISYIYSSLRVDQCIKRFSLADN
jgi:hypothetical protein